MKSQEELKDLKLKSATELQRLLSINREKLRDLRFKISQSQQKNIREIREVKKRIARILTLLKQKANQPVEKSETTEDGKLKLKK